MYADLIISIIAAVADNGTIGRDNDIPWKLQNDLKHFANLTKNRKVIVGRKTYESILKKLGCSLPNRQTIIITRQQNFLAPNDCQIATSWKNAIEKLRGEKEEVFVIGGAEIYLQALPYAKRIYLTKVHIKCDGDAFFPQYDKSDWQEVFSERHTRDQENEFDYTFTILDRKNSSPSFVNLKNARYEEQRKVMENIQKEGFCPFCPEHTSKSELMPIIKQGEYWHIRQNKWPYQNTRIHLIMIHNSHIEKLSEINSDSAKEFFEFAKWIEDEYQITGGAIGLRFGDFRLNGGTVLHLHAHLIIVNITDQNDPKYQPVRFRVG